MKYIFITGPARSGQTTIVNKLNTHDNIHVFDEVPPCLPWDWDNHKRTDEFLDQIDNILKNHGGGKSFLVKLAHQKMQNHSLKE